jgi:acyl-CoA reductase-like NAD-dependent aldehyde dehydrogenase
MDELLLIDGRRVPASGGETFRRTDPFTGRTATVAASASVADALGAAESAADAFDTWSQAPPKLRRDLLLEAARVMESRLADFTAIMAAEIGATAAWARFNVGMAAGMLREAAGQVYQVKGEVLPTDLPGAMSLGLRVPAGVVLSMAPWNAPLVLAMRAMAFPVAYGNTVVLKASELCPAAHLALGQVFADAGFPPGVVNVLSADRAGTPAVVEALIGHPAVRRVNFTGSTAVGRIIGELSGRHLKPSVLELGGKNPLIVLADADLDYAANAAAFGAFANNGQACMAANRIIVDRSVGQSFVDRLVDRAKSLRVGDPRHETTQIGPLADPGAPQRVRGLIDDAYDHGAVVAAGGTNDGTMFTPTVLVDVTDKMSVYHEEIFGPVAPITFVDSVEEAIRIGNDTPFGLSAGVLTADKDKGLLVAGALRTGMAHVNDQPVNDEPHVPFGGVGDSGYGRFGGSSSIQEFTDLRWTTVQHHPREFHM